MSWLHYCTDVVHRRSTTLCTMFGRILGMVDYVNIFGCFSPWWNSARCKFTLRQSLAFSYIGTVTARHSSSGRQPNCGVVQGMELRNFRSIIITAMLRICRHCSCWERRAVFFYTAYSAGRPWRGPCHIFYTGVLNPVWPVVTYGCESCPLRKNEEIRLEAFDMKSQSEWQRMEKVRPWCGQPSDRGRLRNTEQSDEKVLHFTR